MNSPPVEPQITSQAADELPASYGCGGSAAGCRRGFSPCQRDGCFECLCVELHLRGLYSQKVAVYKEQASSSPKLCLSLDNTERRSVRACRSSLLGQRSSASSLLGAACHPRQPGSTKAQAASLSQSAGRDPEGLPQAAQAA